MTAELFDTPQAEPIERDRNGRPRVVLPDGSKSVYYTRATKFIECMEDPYHLTLWKQRMVAVGLAERSDLLVSVAAHRNDREQLNQLVDQAREAARANAASRTGTALHALTDQRDRGERILVPPAYRPDIEAYQEATAGLVPVHIEQFCVQDELRVGGTPDRVVWYVDLNGNGRHYIADVKTGSIDFRQLKFAMQFAIYARSKPYDHVTGKRWEWPEDLDQDKAILIHLPQGEGRCELYWVDIAEGWEAVRIAERVRAWRNRGKHLIAPFRNGGPYTIRQSALVQGVDAAGMRNLIRTQSTINGVRQLYREARELGYDVASIEDECKRRVAILEEKHGRLP